MCICIMHMCTYVIAIENNAMNLSRARLVHERLAVERKGKEEKISTQEVVQLSGHPFSRQLASHHFWSPKEKIPYLFIYFSFAGGKWSDTSSDTSSCLEGPKCYCWPLLLSSTF